MYKENVTSDARVDDCLDDGDGGRGGGGGGRLRVVAGGGAGDAAEGRGVGCGQDSGGRRGGDSGLGRTVGGAGGNGGQQRGAKVVGDGQGEQQPNADKGCGGAGRGPVAVGEAGERRQAEPGDCVDGECGLCALGGVKAVRVESGTNRALVVDEFQDCEEGDDDGERRPRPVFREELGVSAEKIDVVADVYDSDGNSGKGEREKDKALDRVLADSEDGVLVGAGSEEGAFADGGADSEEDVPVGAPAVSEEGVTVSEPVDSGDGVPAEAPVGSEDGVLAEAPVGSGDSALVGDGGKGVSAGDSVWKEVAKVKSGSFVLEQGPRSPIFKEVATPVRVTSYLSAADEFDLKNGAWYLSGGSGGTPPSASWPNQAWKTPSASGRPQTRR